MHSYRSARSVRAHAALQRVAWADDKQAVFGAAGCHSNVALHAQAQKLPFARRVPHAASVRVSLTNPPCQIRVGK